MGGGCPGTFRGNSGEIQGNMGKYGEIWVASPYSPTIETPNPLGLPPLRGWGVLGRGEIAASLADSLLAMTVWGWGVLGRRIRGLASLTHGYALAPLRGWGKRRR